MCSLFDFGYLVAPVPTVRDLFRVNYFHDHHLLLVGMFFRFVFPPFLLTRTTFSMSVLRDGCILTITKKSMFHRILTITNVLTKVSRDCLTRMSHANSWYECLTRMSRAIVSPECLTRMSHASAQPVSHDRRLMYECESFTRVKSLRMSHLSHPTCYVLRFLASPV